MTNKVTKWVVEGNGLLFLLCKAGPHFYDTLAQSEKKCGVPQVAGPRSYFHMVWAVSRTARARRNVT